MASISWAQGAYAPSSSSMDPKSNFSGLLAGEDRVLLMHTVGEPGENDGLWDCCARGGEEGGRNGSATEGGKEGGRDEAIAAVRLGGGGVGALSHSS
jgi:hypothetical protein